MFLPSITLNSNAFVALTPTGTPSTPSQMIESVEGNGVLFGTFAPTAEQAPGTASVNVSRRPGQTPGTRGQQESNALYTFGEESGEATPAGADLVFAYPLAASVNGIGGGGARYAVVETIIASGPAILSDFAYVVLRWPSPRI